MSGSVLTRRSTAALLLAAGLLSGCAGARRQDSVVPPAPPAPAERHDKTVRGAGIGAAAGAAGALLLGKRAADEILVGAAIGAVAGAGVGAYLDSQERKLANIPGTTVERTDKDTLMVRFDSDVLFEAGSARPTAQSLATLAEVGDVLVRYPKTAVVVQGHTDATGTSALNQELSEQRALAVKDLLVDRGVAARRMAAIGHGELYPIASNSFEEGRRRNRRVTIMLRAT
jgi:outer membrane protein OmpA-like peptidoglycan-associated protein